MEKKINKVSEKIGKRAEKYLHEAEEIQSEEEKEQIKTAFDKVFNKEWKEKSNFLKKK